MTRVAYDGTQVAYQVYVTEEHAMIKRTLAKNALHAAAMIGRLAACAGQ